MHKGILLFSLFLFLAACSPQEIKLGETTEQQLISQRGTPVRTEVSSKNSESRTISFSDGESFQSDKGIIRGHYRQPTRKEVDLNYWRSQWADKAKIFQVHGSGAGERLEIQEALSGTSVIYNPLTARVERVMDYKRE
jgi:hypothetical protein